eukprot:SAG31_NODE_18103_length_646_cov_4.215722_2_plen_105_part_00
MYYMDAPFFVFGAGYWAEVLAALGHGIRAGGVEIVPRRAAALGDMLEALEVSPETFSHLFSEAVDLATKPRGTIDEFGNAVHHDEIEWSEPTKTEPASSYETII